MNFFGLMNFQAPYLPWVLCGFSILLGGSTTVDIIGIHISYIPLDYLFDFYNFRFSNRYHSRPHLLLSRGRISESTWRFSNLENTSNYVTIWNFVFKNILFNRILIEYCLWKWMAIWGSRYEWVWKHGTWRTTWRLQLGWTRIINISIQLCLYFFRNLIYRKTLIRII